MRPSSWTWTPQANSTYALLGEQPESESLYEVLVTQQAQIPSVTRATNTSGLKLVPSNIFLSSAESELMRRIGRESLLARKLRDVATDYVVIDTPPSRGILTINALVAATDIIIPVAMSTFAVIGLSLLEETIAELKEDLDLASLRITGILGTFCDRTRISKAFVAALRQRFGELVFETVIPRTVRLEEANNQSLTIFEYDPLGPAARAFEGLVKEVMDRVKG